MQKALAILQEYWKHDHFRPLQYEIIASVLEGKDTFAMLPTGGGKSICFQLPALMNDGICLVVSPLVALIKDQVANLQQRNIKAVALTGGIPIDEIIQLLDNCEFGNYKFLYLSPERLQSDWILDRIKNLPINLIAIDEAHCVSQWGHDFRPAYLKIKHLKIHFPEIPFLAVTASATKKAQNDILTQLGLQQPAFFRQSFARDNIAYMVFEVEDKLFKIGQILNKNPEPSIIYVRNRKSCLDMSSQLNQMGFRTTYYHGGLHSKEKDKNMQLWMTEKAQVIVATNAFGMGIDKANVKTVLHVQLPENLENYYQEAGRAGRNGQKAYAVLLTNASDSIQANQQFISVLPDKPFLIAIFIKLCNYFQIAYGEGIGEQFTLNLNQFCNQYQLPVTKTYNAVQFLDRQGIITLTQEFSEKVTVQFIIPSKEVLRYMSLNTKDEPIILALLRTYAGICDINTSVNIALIAKKSNTSETEVMQLLQRLKEKQIIDYQAKNNDASLIMNEIREDERTINRVAKYLESQNALKKEQLQSVLDYVTDEIKCKSRLILAYFGEIESKDCGICSWCIAKNKPKENTTMVAQAILELLIKEPLTSRDIQNSIPFAVDTIITAIQQLLENNSIKIQTNNKYCLQ